MKKAWTSTSQQHEYILLLLFSRSVASDSFQLCGLQHARLPCPSPSPGACSNSFHSVSDTIQPPHPLYVFCYIHIYIYIYLYCIYSMHYIYFTMYMCVCLYIYIYIFKLYCTLKNGEGNGNPLQYSCL